MDGPIDLLDPLAALTALDAELEEANRELERTLVRHAEMFEKTMEARSRLVLAFLQCRGCCFRDTGVDVLPCHSHFLCAGYVERIVFFTLSLMARVVRR